MTMDKMLVFLKVDEPNLVCRLFTIINCEISIVRIVAGLVRPDHYYKDNY